MAQLPQLQDTPENPGRYRFGRRKHNSQQKLRCRVYQLTSAAGAPGKKSPGRPLCIQYICVFDGPNPLVRGQRLAAEQYGCLVPALLRYRFQPVKCLLKRNVHNIGGLQ